MASQRIPVVLDLEGSRGKAERPAVTREVRQLIRRLNRENPLSGAPHIHGELGLEVCETSVGKYMLRRREPQSQTWRTFLENHVNDLVSVDFFSADGPFPGPLRIPAVGPRQASRNPLQRDRASREVEGLHQRYE